VGGQTSRSDQGSDCPPATPGADAESRLMAEEQFDRVFALMKFDRDELIGWLGEYFGLQRPDGTYCYNLVRAKSAFGSGNMTLDDFEQFDETETSELADFLLNRLKNIET
jgi:hypothetical protein